MKKIFPIFLAVLCLCTACGKSSARRPPTIPHDQIDWDRVYAYKDKYIFSKERIEGKVRYIDDIDILLEEVVEEIQNRMQTAYENNWKDVHLWDSYSDGEENLFAGNGYYISKIPIAQYNNNLNILLDELWLFIFNEDMTVRGSVWIEGLEEKNLDISMYPRNYFGGISITESMPDMDFVIIQVFDTTGSVKILLGEDNQIYGVADEEKNKYTIEGDVFNALPEEMHFSFGKIIDKDNLIWVEYKN